MPIVKKIGRFFIIVNEFTGIPVISRRFNSRSEALQVASTLGGRGF